MARFIHKTADPGLRKSDKMWKGCSRKSTYSLLFLLAAQNVHHNSRMNTMNRKLLCDIKSNYQQRQLCLFGRGLCSVRGAWNKMSARLTDTSPFSSAVTVAVEWCEVVAVCLPPSVCRVWLDTARQNDASRFPTADRCVAAESALETQTRHLRHATVSFPLTSAVEWNVSLFQFKRKTDVSQDFFKKKKCFWFVEWLEKLGEIGGPFIFCFQQEEWWYIWYLALSKHSLILRVFMTLLLCPQNIHETI